MKLKTKLKSIWKIISHRGDGGSSIPTPADSYFNGDDEEFLVDFRGDRFGSGYPVTSNSDSSEPKKITVPVKPRDVIDELGRKPSQWSLEGLEVKLAILRTKRGLITQRFAKQEVEGLIICLENRHKYDRRCSLGMTFREYFSHYDATDEARIDALLKKHNLVMKRADIFVPEFPADAVKVMDECTKLTDELCGKKPQFFVIANEDQFRDANGKRDPILLVQSPFGFYYYILGAWDKEMLYLPEL